MSKTERFLEELFEFENDSIEVVSEEEYRKLIINGYETRYIKDLDLYHNVGHQPFPLLEVKVLRNDSISTNYEGGCDSYLEFVFKYKGKYFHYYNVDSI